MVSHGRTHTEVLGFCTWPRPYSGSYILKYVLSEQVIGLSGLRLNGYPHEKHGPHDESYPCPRDTLGSLHSSPKLVFLTVMLLVRYAGGVRLHVLRGDARVRPVPPFL